MPLRARETCDEFAPSHGLSPRWSRRAYADAGNRGTGLLGGDLGRCSLRRISPHLALSVISLLRSDLVAFGCEADIRTVDPSNQSDVAWLILLCCTTPHPDSDVIGCGPSG